MSTLDKFCLKKKPSQFFKAYNISDILTYNLLIFFNYKKNYSIIEDDYWLVLFADDLYIVKRYLKFLKKKTQNAGWFELPHIIVFICPWEKFRLFKCKYK